MKHTSPYHFGLSALDANVISEIPCLAVDLKEQMEGRKAGIKVGEKTGRREDRKEGRQEGEKTGRRVERQA